MSTLGLASPLAAALLLVPAAAFAALGLMGSAPGEWGQGALLAWTCLAATLVAGAGLQAAGPLASVIPLLGFAAIMIGGPPGLLVAALAAALLLVPGLGAAAPRWLPIGLAVLPALVALRRLLAG